MGSELSPEVLAAFVRHLDGMDKEALKIPGLGRAAKWIGEHSKGLFSTPAEVGKRLNPATWPRAYKSMAARTGKLKEMGNLSKKEFAAAAETAANAPREGFMKHLLPEKIIPRTLFREGAHLGKHVKDSVPLGDIARGAEAAKGLSGPQRIRMMAEELSRRGWTGKGGLTKYVPVGSKGQVAGFSASAIPGVVNAPKATRTGEGATLEKGLGELGSVGGMVVSSGLGFVPGMTLWGLGQYTGSKAGRVLDRLRAGASLGEAVSAPSPQEAQRSLQKIQKYYG